MPRVTEEGKNGKCRAVPKNRTIEEHVYIKVTIYSAAITPDSLNSPLLRGPTLWRAGRTRMDPV